jgi:hypothetical protein
VETIGRNSVVLVLVDNFSGSQSDSIRRYKTAYPDDSHSLLVLPGGVDLLRVKR